MPYASDGLIASYADLKAAVIDLLNRPDLVNQPATWIQLAEGQFNRTIRHRQMLTHATASVSTEYVPMPPDFLGATAFSITSTLPQRWLRFVTPHQANELAAKRNNVTARPDSYSIVGTNFRFSWVPDQPYTADLQYWSQIPPLATAGQNWLLTEYPDLYLYGAALQAVPYLSDDERLGGWQAIYQNLVDQINQANQRESMGDMLSQFPRFAP